MGPVPPPERPQEPSTSLSKVVKRDIHALLVAADLLGQGFAVFHKLGRASPCDLVMVQGRQCWRVAMRTAHDSVRPYSRGWPDPWVSPNPERFDVVAYVLSDGVIRDEPPLEPLCDGNGWPVPCGGRRVGRSSGLPTCARWQVCPQRPFGLMGGGQP